jgi:hypothetical protein
MKTTDETKQRLLAELIDHSAKIDLLAVEAKQTVELEALRIRQREITELLHTLEEPNSGAWENIGDGG